MNRPRLIHTLGISVCALFAILITIQAWGWSDAAAPPPVTDSLDVLYKASIHNLAETRRLSDQWLKRLRESSHSDSAALIREDRDAR